MEAGKRISPDQKQVDGRWYWPDSWGYRKALEIKIERLQARVAELESKPTVSPGLITKGGKLPVTNHVTAGLQLWRDSEEQSDEPEREGTDAS